MSLLKSAGDGGHELAQWPKESFGYYLPTK